jgi:hypothetical protein
VKSLLKLTRRGLLSSVAMLIASSARGGFGIFQVGGASIIPAGVTLRAIDGGSTYFQNGYFNGTTQVPFSASTSFPTSIPYTAGTVVYTNGWDDPKFIGIGGFLFNPSTTGGTNMYHDLGWNTLFGCQSNTTFSALTTAGISIIPQNDEFFSAQGGTNNGSFYFNSCVNGPAPVCVTGLLIADEPQYQNVLYDPLNGISCSANGTHPVTLSGSTGTINNTIQDGHPWLLGLAGSTFCISQTYNISPSNSTGFFFPTLQTTYPTPNATTRGAADMISWDLYTMVPARYAAFWGQNEANAVDGNFGASAPHTMLEMARGTHQGIWIDYMRNFCTNNLAAGATRPTSAALTVGNVKINIPYDIGMQECNWEFWSILIHGARFLEVFDHDDDTGYFNHTLSSGFMQGANTPQEGYLLNTDCSLNQTVTFTGVISGTTLTVSGMTQITTAASGLPGGQLLNAGMEIVTINGVTQSPPVVIQTQLTFATEGTFTGTATSGGNLTVASLSGFIPVPSILLSPGGIIGGGAAIPSQSAGTVSGNGTYQYNRGFTNTGPTAGWSVFCPGMNGTYQVSGGTAASPVTMVAKQPNPVVLGSRSGVNNATGHIYGQVQATCTRIRDLAPVLNSQFAIGYVKSSSTNVRYVCPTLPDGVSPVPHGYGGPSSGAARTFFLSTGIDCCVHYYQGPTYSSAISGESITTNTFYIFATTAYPEDTAPNTITCTFSTAAISATTATVIGESRTIPIVAGAFSDTFEFAWTVHIYKIT